jgi:Fe-S-cluster containining protein
MGGSDATEAELKKILKANHPNYFRKIGKDHYEMKSKKGVCPYLNKDYSCQIEDTKPLMCKSWPVDPDYKGKKAVFMLMQCPLTPLLTPRQIKEMKKQAGKIKPHIINAAFSESKLSKSDIDLIYNRYQKFKGRNLI